MSRTRPRGRVRPARRLCLMPLGGGRRRYSTIGPLAATRLLTAACVIGAGASAARAAEKTDLAGRPAPATLAVPSDTETTKHLVSIAGMIGDNLYVTGVARGVLSSVMEGMVMMLGHVVDFQRDLKPRHRYEILYEVHLDKEGAHRRVGNLVYASLRLDERGFNVWRYTPPGGEPDYFDSEGRSVVTGLLRTPVDGAKVSSGFGLRKHPILGYSRMHRGIDFAVPKGTPIYAADALAAFRWQAALVLMKPAVWLAPPVDKTARKQ